MIVVCRKMFFRLKGICFLKNCCTFALPNVKKGFGVVAQMVEQRTENPCVTGSIPVDATPDKKPGNVRYRVFLLITCNTLSKNDPDFDRRIFKLVFFIVAV